MSQPDINREVYDLVKQMEKTQYEYRNHKGLIPHVPVMTRQDLRNIKINASLPSASTSGSTGEPVTVQKFRAQYLWLKASNIRELLWRKWDTSKNLAVITAAISHAEIHPWIINPYLFKNKPGKVFTHSPRGDLQHWLDNVPCDYLFSYPSIIAGLNTASFMDIKSTSERGGTLYSCEEAGTIAIECPDNPEVYHVMENIIVEIDNNNEVILTDITHPYLKRYRLGDHAEFARCPCGRKLQTLKKDVLGRVRHLALAPDGSRFWPIFGSISFAAVAPNLKRFQVIQSSLTDVTLKAIGDLTIEEENAIKQLMRERLGDVYTFDIQYVSEFPLGKFEEFICLV